MTPKTEIDKQELAERVAKLRGIEDHGAYVCGNDSGGGSCDYGGYRLKGRLFAFNFIDLADKIFSDIQFLPMVLEAEEKGWQIFWRDDLICFGIPLEVLQDEKDFEKETEDYSVLDNGHMIALCLAYCEALEGVQP